MKRAAADDADDGSVVAAKAQVAGNSAIFRFKRALNRGDVSSVVEWSANLRDWYPSGQSNGSFTVNIRRSTGH